MRGKWRIEEEEDTLHILFLNLVSYCSRVSYHVYMSVRVGTFVYLTMTTYLYASCDSVVLPPLPCEAKACTEDLKHESRRDDGPFRHLNLVSTANFAQPQSLPLSFATMSDNSRAGPSHKAEAQGEYTG